ncbi:uncharacterized protein CANTADRAFT_32498, partial [Suhomyces tanzawaensis NRRL Y-17324]
PRPPPPIDLTNASHTNLRKGYKLGSASAAWKKIKSATVASGSHEGASGNTDTTTSDAGISEALPLSAFGSQGDTLLFYPTKNILEVWSWRSPNAQSDSDTLFLHYQTSLDYDGIPLNFAVFSNESDQCYSVILLIPDEDHVKIQNHLISPQRAAQLTQEKLYFFPSKTYHIKKSPSNLLVANDLGYIILLRIQNDKICHPNSDSALHSIRKSSCQPIVLDSPYDSLEESEILLKTSCDEDGTPIFDIVNDWLVYSPVKTEYKFLRAVSNTREKKTTTQCSVIDPIITNYPDPGDHIHKKKHSALFTPVKLPPPGPLLNKFISTFSNSALDGLFKLSEISASKMKSYYSDKKSPKHNETSHESHDISLNTVSKAMGKLLYSTASSVQNSTRSLKPNSNQLIKVLDLSNDKVLGIFKPPGGVSKLSLSPNDLQLVNSNLRGDSLFLWDLYRLPTEVSLLGKFTRGKTSAIVEDIFWFTNNFYDYKPTKSSNTIRHGAKNNEFTAKFTNSGFGCITKSTGSVHWFNTNYLSESISHKKGSKKAIEDDQLEDSWILPSFGAKKFVALPLIANDDSAASINNIAGASNSSKSVNKEEMNQLAVIDKNNQLKLISTLNGRHFYKYSLPDKPTAKEVLPNLCFDKAEPSTEKSKLVIPLSQAEIETCSPFSNLINSSNIVFETFEFDGEGDDRDLFFEVFKEFGNELPGRKI